MTEPGGLPAWLTVALATQEHRRPATDLREETPAELLPGDLCVVTPYGDAAALGRLFLVTDSGPGRGVGMLVSAETELASEVDAILDPTDSGLAYPVAALTRFAGPIWTTQVRRRVGAVPAEILDQLLALAWSDEPDDVTVTRGMALQPEGVDPRYPALRALSAELDGLTEHCRHHPAVEVSVLDPALAEAPVLRVVLAEPGWEAAVADAGATADFRDRLLDSLDLLSQDEQRAAAPFIERAMNALPAPTGEIAPLFAGHRDAAALGRAVASVGHSAPVVRVLSHRRCRTVASSVAARQRAGGKETTVVLIAISGAPLSEAA